MPETSPDPALRPPPSVLPRVQYHPSIRTPPRPPGCEDHASRGAGQRATKTHRRTRPGGGATASDDRVSLVSSSGTPDGGATGEQQSPEAAGTKQNGGQRAVRTTQNGGGGGDSSGVSESQNRHGNKSSTPESAVGEKAETKPATRPKKAPKKSQNSRRSGRSAGGGASPGPQGTGGGAGLDPVLLEPRPGSSLDPVLVERVEVQTRGQRNNPDWFRFRKNRITASVAHAVAHSAFANGKSSTPPASYVRNIIGESGRVQTRAMTWGVDHEAEAVRRYQEHQSAALGREVLVRDCGLFIDPARSWLAASPDGIVTDARTGQWLRCLEVKCPFKHRARSVTTATREDPHFCLELLDQQGAPQLALKRTHPYFTQVQVQLAVTGLKMADFVVFTLRDLVVVPVRFDQDFWDQTVTKLERFYRDAVIPAISPAWSPET